MTIAGIEPHPAPLTPASAAGQPVLRIEGGVPLSGEITIGGAKNAALPLLAATLLTRDECVLNNAPELSDIRTMLALLESLGADVDYDCDARRIRVRARDIEKTAPPADLVRSMRASFLVAGPLLARFGSFTAGTPGGCQLGSRPVDVDVRGFRNMGADVEESDDQIQATASNGGLHGAEIYMDYPSHTGTENLLLAATLAEGRTSIVNASCEPEIMALGMMLNRMGARISGLGTPKIDIEGVDRLHGVTETILPDRLEAGTYAIAAVLTGGEVVLHRTNAPDMLPLRAKLEEAGAEVWWRGTSMMVRPTGRLRAVEVQTLPFPGFPTDLQAAFGVLLTQAEGVSKIKERVFDNRMRYTDELVAMGARIDVERIAPNRYGPEAIIHGPTPLHGADVRALDIRAGAGVVLAGLVASGTTTVHDVHHLARGYEGLVPKLQSLGARITEETT